MMIETKHTPGPWTVESDEATIVRDPDGGAICQLKFLRGKYGLNGRRTDEEVSANARLIAAALELLEALRQVMEWIDNWSPVFVHDDEWPETKNTVEAAIAKATARRP